MYSSRQTKAVILVVAMGAAASARAESDVQRVARQFREYCVHESTDRGERLLDDVELPKTAVAEAVKQLAALQEDGSWRDIDYASGARSSWPAYDHLTRVLSMAVYARRPDTPAAEATQCLAGVHRALAYWQQHDFQCPNWWYNEIGVPKITGTIALLLADDLTPDERAFVADTVLVRSKVGSRTGQNRVWLAGNGLLRGALVDDEALVRAAAAVIADEIRVTESEGIQPDWSFHQHGPQQQFGNYGMAYAVEMSRWATVLRGTQFALPADKVAILRSFLVDGVGQVLWRGALDISACGRQIWPGSPRSKAGVFGGVARSMSVVDAEHTADYRALVARNAEGAANDLVGNRYFWRSDYMIHRRPDAMVTLKMCSRRVIGGESLNGENLSGLHLADGALFVYRSGHKYDDIFPVWDWRQVPGTTVALDDASLRPVRLDPSKEPAFVGGVSDGRCGCAAMDFRRGGVTARKAWFFAGDVVVCLGADVTSLGEAPVATTLNQSLLAGPIKVHQAGQTRTMEGAPSRWGADRTNPVDWIEHDGLRYVFPVPQALTVSAQQRTGDWRKVFDTPSTPSEPVTKDVFMLWLDHARPKSASYAYYLVPAGPSAEPSVEILSNTAQLQAVKIGPSWLAAVVWNAGTVDLGGTVVEVDQPCLLLVETRADGRHVTVSDPMQQLQTLRVNIGGVSQTVALPQGGEAGKSVTLTPTLSQRERE